MKRMPTAVKVAGLAAVVYLLIVMPLLLWHSRRQPGTSAVAPRASTAAPGASTTPSDPGASPTIERLAEACVDTGLLHDGTQSADPKYELSFWVAPRAASLDCSFPVKWAVCRVANGWLLDAGDEGSGSGTDSACWRSMKIALDVLSDSTDKNLKFSESALMEFLILADPKLHDAADGYEAKWLQLQDAKHDALVIRQARALAPLVAMSELQTKRNALIQRALQGLKEDSEGRRRGEASWKRPADLAKAVQAYCQRITQAEQAGNK